MGLPAHPLVVVDEEGELLVCARTHADATAAEAAVRLGADTVSVPFLKVSTRLDVDPGYLFLRLLWREESNDAVAWAAAALQSYIGLPARFNGDRWVLNDVVKERFSVIQVKLRPTGD